MYDFTIWSIHKSIGTFSNTIELVVQVLLTFRLYTKEKNSNDNNEEKYVYFRNGVWVILEAEKPMSQPW